MEIFYYDIATPVSLSFLSDELIRKFNGYIPDSENDDSTIIKADSEVSNSVLFIEEINSELYGYEDIKEEHIDKFNNMLKAYFNNKKGNRTPSEVRMYLKIKAYQPTISEFLRLKVKKLGINDVLRDLGIY